MYNRNKGNNNKKQTNLIRVIILTIMTVNLAPLMSYGVEVEEENVETLEEQEDKGVNVEEGVIDTEYPETEESEPEEDEIIEGEQKDEHEITEESERGEERFNNVNEGSKESGNTLESESTGMGMASMRMQPQSENIYVLADDSDFSGTANGNFRYIGTDEYVEIPDTIKGVNVTSYQNMFRETSVKGVKSANKNVTDMSYMFFDLQSTTLDVRGIDTEGVTGMGYMFGGEVDFNADGNIRTNKMEELRGLETFDTSKVESFNSMFSNSRVKDLYISNFDTTNAVHMNSMFNRSEAKELDVTGFDTSKVVSMSRMFATTNTEELDLSNFDTGETTNMGLMFQNAQAKYIDVSSFDTGKVTRMSSMFQGTEVLELDLRGFDTTNVVSMETMFSSSKVNKLDLRSFNTSNVKNMQSMFSGSEATEILGLNGFDTSRVTDMSNMFYNSKAKDLLLGRFDTSNVINMSYMFQDSDAEVIDLSSFDTGKVTSMGYMFTGSKVNQLDLSHFNTDVVVNMDRMFMDTDSTLIDVSNFNTKEITNMRDMFKGSNAKELDLRSFNTSNVIDMSGMFQGSKATNVDISSFTTEKVTDMGNMFYGSHAKELDLKRFDTSKVTSMENMFRETQATYIDVSSFDTGRVTTMSNMFNGSKATILDLSGFETRLVTDMDKMFKDTKAKELDLSSFRTEKIVDMSDMFNGSEATHIDVSNFDTLNVLYMDRMFQNTKVDIIDLSSFDTTNIVTMRGIFNGTLATTGYARSMEDVNKFNKENGKPRGLVFESKGYVVAEDADFYGKEDGTFKYIGDDLYIEIPHVIKGINVTSYRGMFEGTDVRGVISRNRNVVDMSNMFKGNTSEDLDVGTLYTGKVENMSGMFEGIVASELDLRGFSTVNVEDMSRMFMGTSLEELDLSTFNTERLINSDDMFKGTSTVEAYARTYEDADKFNKSKSKPTGLEFNVWGLEIEQNPTEWTNKEVGIKVTAEGGRRGIRDIEMLGTPEEELGDIEGVNLLSREDIEKNNIEYGNNVTNMRFVRTREYIPVRGNTFYTLSVNSPWAMSGSFWEYTEDKVIVSSTNLWADGVKYMNVLTDANTRYLRFRVRDGDNTKEHPVEEWEIKLEVGEKPTPYTPAPEDIVLEGNSKGYTVTRNGTFIFRATDLEGNTVEVAHTVGNIDVGNPTANIIKGTTGITSSDVPIYVNAEDDLSGVDFITLPDGEKVYGDYVEYKAKDNGEYTFTITDKAGNTTTYTEEVNNIDRTIPKMSIEVDTKEWTKDPVNIKVSTETSLGGLSHIVMVGEEGYLYGKDDRLHSEEDINLMGKNDIEVNNIEKGYNTNNSGFIRSKGYIPVEPNTEYVITVHSDWLMSGGFWEYAEDKELLYSENIWSNNVKSITIKTTKDTRYLRFRARDGEGTKRRLEDWKLKLEKGSVPTPYTVAPKDEVLENNSKIYKVKNNGVYTFKAFYNNGNTNEVAVNVTNIDLKAPEIAVLNNPKDWVEDDEIELEIKATDNKQSGVKSITLPDKTVITGDEAIYKVNENGDYDFTVEDILGNKNTYTVTVDKMMIPYFFYIYDSNGKPLQGAGFELLRNEIVHKTEVSDVNGLVDFGKVPPTGKYTIKQIKAPDGYIVDPVEKDVDVEDDTDPIEIINYPRGTEMPSTGTVTIYILEIIGVTTIILTGYISSKRKRKRVK